MVSMSYFTGVDRSMRSAVILSWYPACCSLKKRKNERGTYGKFLALLLPEGLLGVDASRRAAGTEQLQLYLRLVVRCIEQSDTQRRPA